MDLLVALRDLAVLVDPEEGVADALQGGGLDVGWRGWITLGGLVHAYIDGEAVGARCVADAEQELGGAGGSAEGDGLGG